ncbi:MAG TPA: SRPBCC domain-containing protein [Gaiellaceae bacterium]|nr:SRPBCC domain-containing protein [Gaiellaceae bacterium]
MESTKPTQRIEPVRKRVLVEAPVEHAFRVFTERIGEWWPVRTHSVHEDLAETAVLEPRLGGALVEVWRDGREQWGTVTVWEPPRRLVYTWHPGYSVTEATEVEVRFTPQEGSTLVELEHRGWEARGERAAQIRANYESGWDPVLARYEAAASA